MICEDELVAGLTVQLGDRFHLRIVSQWRHRLPRALSRFGGNLLASRATMHIFKRLPRVHDCIAMQQDSNYNRSGYRQEETLCAKSDETLVFDKQLGLTSRRPGVSRQAFDDVATLLE